MTLPFFEGVYQRQVQYYVNDNTKNGFGVVGINAVIGRIRLSTEADSTVTLTFTGIKSGSELYLFDSTGAVLAGTESATDPISFTLDRYATGNPANNIRILVASLGYENIDLAYTLPASDASIPIQQRIDRNYRNP